MPVEIIDPGLATSVQDLGRQGHYNVGIPPSGAVDRFAAIAANTLVGNGTGEAVFESPYMGPKLRFTEPGVVAVTGAQAPVFINGTAAPSWESLQVAAGDVLSFGIFTEGARIYVAVAGGLNVPIVLGSRSLYALGTWPEHRVGLCQSICGQCTPARSTFESYSAFTTSGFPKMDFQR